MSLRRLASAFTLVFLAFLALALAQGYKPFYYDAGEYWSLGDTFTRHGGFSFLRFADPVRGYLLPLVLHFVSVTAGELHLSHSVVVKIANAALFAVVLTVLAPRYARVIWPEMKFGYVRRLVLAAVFYVFWSGWLSFPLSDVPALALALVALLAVAPRPGAGSWARAGTWLLAGVAASAAMIVRPAYVPLVPTVLVLAAWTLWADARGAPARRLKIRGRALLPRAAMLAGMALIALPQSLAMHHNFHIWSPIPGTASNLARLQLTAGLGVQRYETYVGDPREYGAPGVVYRDNSTINLRRSLKDGYVDNWGDYFELIAEHPWVMARVFGRRIVNGFDQRYSTPYIEHLELRPRRLFRWANFTVLFAALLRLLWPAARRTLGPSGKRFFVALLLLCASTPATAVETRFFLPLYLLAYILVLAPGWPTAVRIPGPLRRKIATIGVIIAVYGLFMAGAWIVTSDTTRSMVVPPPATSLPDLAK
jgi:hypothetical protein